MDIMSGLTAISKALEITKALKDIEGQANDATYKLQIADLHSALADAKIALAEARENLADKNQEISRLNEVHKDRMPVVRYRGYNFGIDEDGNSIGRPFCPICEAKDGSQMQIGRIKATEDMCPRCKAPYSVGSYPWKLPDEKKPANQK